MRKTLIALALFLPALAFAAPFSTYQNTILPTQTATYELGTTTKAWFRVFSNQFCLTSDSCISTWPSSGGAASWPFPVAGNATTSLTQFNGGLTAYASTTIGNGTTAGGLTISGGATTTGTAYFAGNVGIGTSTPSTKLGLTGGSFFQAGSDGTSLYTTPLLGGVDIGATVGGNLVGGQILYAVGNTGFEVSQAPAGGTGCTATNASSCQFRIYDISTSTPRYIGGAEVQNSTAADLAAEGVYVSGNYAFVVTSNATGVCNNTQVANGCELRILDISNPTAPVQVGGVETGVTTRNVVVRGRYAYITMSSITGNDFRIIDISDPTNPVTRGGIDFAANANGLVVRGNYAYVTVGSTATNNFQIVDVSNPDAPVVVGGVNLGSDGVSVAVQGNYAYVIKNNAGITEDLMIYDVSNPAAIATTTAIDLASAGQGISISGRYLYTTQTSRTGNDVRIWDISDPYNLLEVGGADIGTSPFAAIVSGKKMLVGKQNAGIIAGDFLVYDQTGIEVQSAMVHSLEAGSATVDSNLIVAGNAQLGSLNVGNSGIFSRGSLAVTATSTFAGPVRITASGLKTTPLLFVGTSTNGYPVYGPVQGDVIDGELDFNGTAAMNIVNGTGGSCASSGYWADGNIVALNSDFAVFAFLNSGWTGVGCAFGNALERPESTVIANPTGDMDFELASTSPVAYNFYSGTNSIFTVKSTGNVGVGTSSPQAKLETVTTSSGATTLPLFVSNFGTATSTAAGIAFRTSDATSNKNGTSTASIAGILTKNFAGGNGDLVFSNLLSGALIENMRLTSAGNLGIGTTSPSHPLTLAAATKPQLALADGGAASLLWTFRNIGNSFYIATSTTAATSTVAALAFDGTTGAATFGSKATTTFSGGIDFSRFNSTATSTGSQGINLSGGCFAVNGVCIAGSGSVTSVTGTYPIISSGGTTPAISLAFGTTTANTWSGLQTFTNAATTSFTGGIQTTALNVTGATSTFTNGISFNSIGTVSQPTISFGGNEGIYQVLNGTVALTNGAASLQWDGTKFFPGSDALRNIGGASNRWKSLWLSDTATTTSLFVTGSATTTVAAGVEAGTAVAASYFNATSSSATSTFNGGIKSPCFSTDGTTCIAAGSSASLTASTTLGASQGAITIPANYTLVVNANGGSIATNNSDNTVVSLKMGGQTVESQNVSRGFSSSVVYPFSFSYATTTATTTTITVTSSQTSLENIYITTLLLPSSVKI